MAIPITSIGIVVSYAFETESGSRPTTGYKKIPMVKSLPDLNQEPEALDTTSFDNLEYTSSTPGLKDVGGTLPFEVGFSQELFDLWEEEGGVMELWDAAKLEDRAMWVAIDIPGIKKAEYLSVVPSHIGTSETGVNEVQDTTLNFSLRQDPIWAEKPTYAV